MSRGFWDKLPRPFMALAPMSGVTDAAFRRILTRCGKPDVIFSEFVSATGLQSPGREHLLSALTFDAQERPVVAQIFGSRPDDLFATARELADRNFDGIDLNMGCPDRSVVKQGAGSALIGEPNLAREIIHATTEGAGTLPVSVKTRTGFNCSDHYEDWVSLLLDCRPVAITMHFRTRKQYYSGTADWTLAQILVNAAKAAGGHTLVIGNGDIQNILEARARARETGVDGVMIGRAALGNPWVFSEHPPPNQAERLNMMLLHSALFHKLNPDHRRCSAMKKHYKAYVSAFPGAKELRTRLMAADGFEDVERITQAYMARPADELVNEEE